MTESLAAHSQYAATAGWSLTRLMFPATHPQSSVVFRFCVGGRGLPGLPRKSTIACASRSTPTLISTPMPAAAAASRLSRRVAVCGLKSISSAPATPCLGQCARTHGAYGVNACSERSHIHLGRVRVGEAASILCSCIRRYEQGRGTHVSSERVALPPPLGDERALPELPNLVHVHRLPRGDAGDWRQADALVCVTASKPSLRCESPAVNEQSLGLVVDAPCRRRDYITAGGRT